MKLKEVEPVNSDNPTARPFLSRRTKQFLIGAGGVLALLSSALLIYSVLVTPERQPYRDALTQYRQVYDANVAFTNAAIAVNNATASDQQTQNALKAIESAKNSLVAANEALGKQDVLQYGEGKKLYDELNSMLGQYVQYNQSVLDSRQKVRPVLGGADCADALSSSSSYASKANTMRSCAQNMAALNDISDPDYNALVEAYNQQFAKLVPIFEASAALKNPEGADKARQQELTDQYASVLDTIEQANTTFTQGLQASKAKVDITPAAQALDTYLTDKSSVF